MVANTGIVETRDGSVADDDTAVVVEGKLAAMELLAVAGVFVEAASATSVGARDG